MFNLTIPELVLIIGVFILLSFPILIIGGIFWLTKRNRSQTPPPRTPKNKDQP